MPKPTAKARDVTLIANSAFLNDCSVGEDDNGFSPSNPAAFNLVMTESTVSTTDSPNSGLSVITLVSSASASGFTISLVGVVIGVASTGKYELYVFLGAGLIVRRVVGETALIEGVLTMVEQVLSLVQVVSLVEN